MAHKNQKTLFHYQVPTVVVSVMPSFLISSQTFLFFSAFCTSEWGGGLVNFRTAHTHVYRRHTNELLPSFLFLLSSPLLSLSLLSPSSYPYLAHISRASALSSSLFFHTIKQPPPQLHFPLSLSMRKKHLRMNPQQTLRYFLLPVLVRSARRTPNLTLILSFPPLLP